MNPIEILQMIRSSVEDRHRAVSQLASHKKLREDIILHVKKNKGTEDDGIMIFHDCIVAFTKRVFSDRSFELESDIPAYLFGTARYLWLAELKRRQKIPLTDQVDAAMHLSSMDQPTISMIKAEKSEMLQRVLSVLRKNCREVLMYWAGGYSMKEIADLLDYASEGAVRKKKYECYKQLSKWLESNPEIKKILKE